MPETPEEILRRIRSGIRERLGGDPVIFEIQRQEEEDRKRRAEKQERANERRIRKFERKGLDPREFIEEERGGRGVLGTVFDVLSRPTFAVAGATEEALEGGDPFSVVERGLKEFVGKGERTTFGDILRERTEATKGEAAVGGFALDVLTDPLTYLGPGLFRAAAGGLRRVPGITRAATAVKESAPVQGLARAFIPDFEVKQLGEAGKRFIGAREELFRFRPQEEGAMFATSIRQAVGDATPKQLEDVTEQIFKGISPEQLPDDLRGVYDRFRTVFDEVERLDVQAGVLDEAALLDNYLPVRFPEQKGLARIFGPVRQRREAFQRARKFETPLERLEAGVPTELNMARIAALRSAESIRARSTKEFFEQILDDPQISTRVKKHLRPDEVPEGMALFMPRAGLRLFRRDGVVPSKLIKEAQESGQAFLRVGIDDLKSVLSVGENPVFLMPTEIVESLNGLNRTLFNDKATNGLLRGFDAVLNIWKGHATAVNPGFHFRNMYSNWFLAFQSGVRSPAAFRDATKMQVAMREPGLKMASSDFGEKILRQTVPGTKLTYADMIEEAGSRGVYNMGWFGADIPDTVKQVLDRATTGGVRGIGKKLNPFSQEFALLRGGRAMGTTIENNSRLAVFVDQVRKGASFDDAARHTKKFLFDYGELTPFEKGIMKRVVPFYTWMRKNIPLQIEMLARQPQQYATVAKAFNEIRGTIDEDSRIDMVDLPEWIRDLNVVQIPKTVANQQMFLNPNLPFQDLNNLLSVREMVSSVNPLFKVPLEIATNRNIFFERDIEEFPGQKRTTPELEFLSRIAGQDNPVVVPARTAHLISNMSPFFRNVAQSLPAAVELAGGEVDPYPTSRLISNLFGIKFIPFSQLRAQERKAFETRNLLDAIQRGVRDEERRNR